MDDELMSARKKTGIILLAGLVLLGCVFTAGCATVDEITGVWKLTGPSEEGILDTEGCEAYMTFAEDGTGYQTFYKNGEEYVLQDTSDTATFYWIRVSDTVYFTLLSGKVVSAPYTAANKTLVTNWGTYTKMEEES